jgi:pyridoxine kinase
MARLLAISSQVVFGNVGLSAVVPALQARAHEVLAVPTILLSSHPGLGTPRRVEVDMTALMRGAESSGAFQCLAGAITGYFATAEQVQATATMIRELRVPHVLVDPVLGDHGRLYVPEDVAVAIREQLVPLATIATPNAFELGWLTGVSVVDIDTAREAARRLNIPEVLATSVPAGPSHLQTLLIEGGEVHHHVSARLPHVPNGTGDFLAGCYLAERINARPRPSFDAAMARLTAAIVRSHGAVLSVN